MTLVTRPVKSPTLPMTFCEKVCTPVTMDAAKSAPGNEVEPLLEDGAEVEAGAKVDELPLQLGS